MAYNYNFNPPFAGGSQPNPNHPYQQAPYQQYPPPGQPVPPGQPIPPGPPIQQGYPSLYPNFPPHPTAPPAHFEPPPAYDTPSKVSNENLLKNPNFEPKFWNPDSTTQEFKSDPWHIEETGGHGWRLEKTPLGSGVNTCPPEAGPYTHCVVGSYQWCKRSQTINLMKRGITGQVMDHQKPCIHIYEWFCSRSDCGGRYEVNVTLLDKNKKPLDHFNSGAKNAGSGDWQKLEHKFFNYPAGVRFIRFQDGSKDSAGWAGHYGAKMCQPTVKVLLAPPTPAPTPPQPVPGPPQPINLLTNPSFVARHWDGNNAGSIDHHPWNIENNREGFSLEREPSGAAKYPAQLLGFDVWCIATSNDTSQRSQTIDLVQKGYSPQFLDQQRPMISVHEWFTSRSDCEGEYFMEAHLLDQYRNRISGCSFHSEVKVAPSGHWKKEEHVFRNIPHGVRFVEFRDGGNDTKFWAGSFGVKMVGAFVGVLHNVGPVPTPTPAGPPIPPKKNLVTNPNFIPLRWDGNGCSEIEFHPWTIISNGGDGAILEKLPYGSGASGYPPELGPNQHCVATSHQWFRRQQTIDLFGHGYQPHMFLNRTMQIYVCEWFTSRGDCIGEFELEAAILNEREDVIPGYRYRSGTRKAPGDRWEKVGRLFRDVPETARYVRFEDASKDTRQWAGHYGARMVGATVIVGKGMEKYEEECTIL